MIFFSLAAIRAWIIGACWSGTSDLCFFFSYEYKVRLFVGIHWHGLVSEMIHGLDFFNKKWRSSWDDISVVSEQQHVVLFIYICKISQASNNNSIFIGHLGRSHVKVAHVFDLYLKRLVYVLRTLWQASIDFDHLLIIFTSNQYGKVLNFRMPFQRYWTLTQQ